MSKSILSLVILFSCVSMHSQQLINDLTIDFDGSPNEVVTIARVNDIDGDGVFGVNNGAFEITNVEGSPCDNSTSFGNNDNLAVVISGVAVQNYTNVTVTIEASISTADFEDCLNPGTIDPVGCTNVSVLEPGGDGVAITVSLGGVDILVAGYCGSSLFGSFSMSGLNIQIGEFLQMNVIGGAQDADESYFIERIEVTGDVMGDPAPLETPEPLHVVEGDVYISDNSKGVILKNDSNECYRLTLGANGSLNTTKVDCPD